MGFPTLVFTLLFTLFTIFCILSMKKRSPHQASAYERRYLFGGVNKRASTWLQFVQIEVSKAVL